MAYSNQTTHYGLPQPTSGDKSTFLDTNEAFGRVDSALYGAATDATAAKQQADDLTLEVNDLKVSVLDLKSSVLDAKTDINLLMANMGQAMTDINNLQTDTIKLKLDVTDIMVSRLPVKIDTFSGQVEDAEQTSYTAVTADGIAYDETNQQLLLKVDGADTVIPFSRGGGGAGKKWIKINGTHNAGYTYEDSNGVSISETGESNFSSAINGENDALAYDVSMDYSTGIFSLKIKYSGDFIVVGENKQTVITAFTTDTSFNVYSSTAFAVDGMAHGIGNIFIEA